MATVKAECSTCSGTGLYSGMCEKKGTAVICIECKGTGCYEFYFKPFIKRKGRRGIETVSQSRGSFIGTGVGSVGKAITYKEFQQGEMP